MQEKTRPAQPQPPQNTGAPPPGQNPLLAAAAQAQQAGAAEAEPAETNGGLRGLWGRLLGRGRKSRETGEEEDAERTPAPEKSREDPEQEALAAAALARAEQENRLPAADSRLYDICTHLLGISPHTDAENKYSLRLFTDEHTLPTAEQRTWLLGIENTAQSIPQYGTLSSSVSEEMPGTGMPPLDATGIAKVSADGMGAYLFLLPPTEGGKDIGAGRAKALLAAEGVVFGLFDDVLAELDRHDRYMTLIKVADGMPPQDGVDGEIVEHYAREIEIHLTVKDDNTIDYKDLCWLQTIREGETLCDIIAPTPGQAGTTVRGRQVKARDGRRPPVPGGQGTKQNAAGTALVAAMDGAVSYQQDRFRVDPLLIVQGNVGTATGNLDVVGDILVHGDIQEGFEVTATGNITVQGMLEGATIQAGGHIQIGRGMNGNSQGRLITKGNVLCKYIENARVEAGGKVICDTIINSEVSSDDSIQVTTGRGTVVGGSITALNTIFAREIGNQSNRSISITLGSSRRYLDEKRELEEKWAVMGKQIETKEKNIAYLSLGAALRPEETALLEELRQGLKAQKMQQTNLRRRIELMQARLNDTGHCRLKADVIYPPVEIMIGRTVKRLRETLLNTVVFWKEGEIHEVTL